ncbi:hypothetical protein [Streptomyces sp. NBC_00996]|uniref:hypothetical protein n=1 Tax=Streptomyces sp. NBC_00996 TaxID=2903710 RepID=UPI00386473F3|nr:hypothetical protein OG390_32380 [Streptomyces sp. NBC_00996]
MPVPVPPLPAVAREAPADEADALVEGFGDLVADAEAEADGDSEALAERLGAADEPAPPACTVSEPDASSPRSS